MEFLIFDFEGHSKIYKMHFMSPGGIRRRVKKINSFRHYVFIVFSSTETQSFPQCALGCIRAM